MNGAIVCAITPARGTARRDRGTLLGRRLCNAREADMTGTAAVLATVLLASTAPAQATDRRFGALAGFSTFGGLAWTSGVSASGWVRVSGLVTVDLDVGRYANDMDGGTRRERHTLISGGIGVRQRSGRVRLFAHFLIGTARIDHDYSSQGGRRFVIKESDPMTLIGGGFDSRVGVTTLRLSLENLRIAPYGSAGLRLNLCVGY